MTIDEVREHIRAGDSDTALKALVEIVAGLVAQPAAEPAPVATPETTGEQA